MQELNELDRKLLNDIGDKIPESSWKVVSNDGAHITSNAVVDVNGKQITLQRRQFIGEEELLKINKYLKDTSSTFSNRSAGAIGTPVANVPLSMVFSPKTGIAQKMREGDKDHLTWWLNQDENQPFRSHKGKL